MGKRLNKSFKKVPAASTYCALPPDKVHPALKSVFTFCFIKSAMRLREDLHKELEPHGLIGPHTGILRLLNVLGPTSQNDLAEQMYIDKASMVKFLDQLEKSKLVLRRASKEDRRIKFIEITAKGTTKLQLANKLREQLEHKFLSVLDPDERAAVLKAMPKLWSGS